jgi:nitrite reductase/ring-hydroxylating ferredoxin subunit
VASLGDIEPGSTLRVELDGSDLLLCRTAEGVFVVDNTCTHARARLDEGRLRGHRIMCPLHGAAFDVRDGSVLSRPATRGLRTHAVRVDGGEIQVALPPPADSA